jgi:hypothetical protein
MLINAGSCEGRRKGRRESDRKGRRKVKGRRREGEKKKGETSSAWSTPHSSKALPGPLPHSPKALAKRS